jgi:hypothetical protein
VPEERRHVVCLKKGAQERHVVCLKEPEGAPEGQGACTKEGREAGTS